MQQEREKMTNQMQRDLTMLRLGRANFNYDDLKLALKIKRLAKAHQRQCENSCNGEGYIRGSFYTLSDENSFIKDVSVFEMETDKIQGRIEKLLDKYKGIFSVEFQGDPRGATVQLSYKGIDLNNLLY